MEIKKITDYTSEELVEIFSEDFKKYADATKFNMSVVNDPCEIYLPFDYNTNKLIYEEAKKNYSYNNIRYRFMVRPIYPELYEYIKKDIQDNNLKHEVRLLPYLTHESLKGFVKNKEVPKDKENIDVYGSPLDTIEFLKTRESFGSAFWLRLDYLKKHIIELEKFKKDSIEKDLQRKCDVLHRQLLSMKCQAQPLKEGTSYTCFLGVDEWILINVIPSQKWIHLEHTLEDDSKVPEDIKEIVKVYENIFKDYEGE